AEAAAPLLSSFLYGKEAKDLTAEQKSTISSIVGLAGTALGATTGDVATTVQSGQVAQNAVENNQYKEFYACNDKKQCVLVDDKPVEQFTFLEDQLISPVRLIRKGQHIFNVTESKNKTQREIVYPTDSLAKKAAETMGYTRTNYRTRNGAVIFKKGNSYISRDVDGHNGGAWKEASSPQKLNSKETRNGTFDINMNRIGD
ncbi:hypothetical protein F951_01242, partial [Acinetobacter soli CIP 110264]